MPQLPTDAIPAAEFLVRHLYRPIEITAGTTYSAIVETEHLDSDKWFWNDDNAKVLEFMSRPDVWRRFPQEASEIMRFVGSMCHGPYIFRRVSAPRLEPVGTDAGVTTYHHSLMRLRCEPRRGAVVASLRYHDERNTDNLILDRNYVEFTYRGRRCNATVEPGGFEAHSENGGGVLRLRYAGEIDFDWGAQPLRLGRLAYTYTFHAASMLFDVEAALDLAPGTIVQDVVLTISSAGFPHNPFKFLITDTRPGATPLFSADKPSQRVLGTTGGSYYLIRQGHISGDSLAVHSLSCGPRPPAGFEVRVTTRRQLAQVIARYEFPGTHDGGRLVAAEQKAITCGGLYERVADYAALIGEAATARDRSRAAYDFSISYDYGVTINAFAKCFAAIPDLPPARREELRALVDTYLGYYLAIAVAGHHAGRATVFCRELAFVILAAVTMHRATGAAEYLDQLDRLCGPLLDLERRYTDCGGEPASGFIMRSDAPPVAHVDCHSAALLALVQASRVRPDARLTAAIDRGLRAYCLGSSALHLGQPERVDGVSTLIVDEAGARHGEPAFWNFKAGLTLRLFAALRAAPDPEMQAVAARHRDRLELFELILRRQLALAMVAQGSEVEIRCSALSGETNSETQPWVMLGLLGHPAD
ncbi:MAG TPA: hypothetical protein VJR70_11155 [Stellaceae bacterium]|nr:hypothetical protein [Stellaceae bacterium]